MPRGRNLYDPQGKKTEVFTERDDGLGYELRPASLEDDVTENWIDITSIDDDPRYRTEFNTRTEELRHYRVYPHTEGDWMGVQGSPAPGTSSRRR